MVRWGCGGSWAWNETLLIQPGARHSCMMAYNMDAIRC